MIKQSQTKMKIDYLKIYVYQQVVKHLQSGQYFPKAIDIKQRRGSMPSLCTCTLQLDEVDTHDKTAPMFPEKQ